LDIKDQAVELDAAIAGLRGDYSNLEARLLVLRHDVACPLSGVTLRIHYPSFRGGRPTDHDLTDAIAHYLTHFALHRSSLNRAYEGFKGLKPPEILAVCSKLRAKAIRTFIKAHKATKRNGEAGELMLFLLTEWMLGAPQILAKMSLKTSPNVPIHGSDGIHVLFDKETKRLKFYFGEAKIHRSLQGALTSAGISIAKALTPSEIQFELDLVESNLETSGLDQDGREALLSYLDPWAKSSNQRTEVITSLIAFDYKGYDNLKEIDPDKRAAEFAVLLERDLEAMSPRVARSFGEAGLRDEEIELFLLPLPSVTVLRERFQALIGWTK
jgi:hypothetical protein